MLVRLNSQHQTALWQMYCSAFAREAQRVTLWNEAQLGAEISAGGAWGWQTDEDLCGFLLERRDAGFAEILSIGVAPL